MKKESFEELFLKKLPVEKSEIKDMDLKVYQDLSKRRDIIQTTMLKDMKITTTDFGNKVLETIKKTPELVEKLTPSLINNQKWKGKTFRRYDITTTLPKIEIGKKQFVNEAISYIRNIWLELGFEEIR